MLKKLKLPLFAIIGLTSATAFASTTVTPTSVDTSGDDTWIEWEPDGKKIIKDSEATHDCLETLQNTEAHLNAGGKATLTWTLGEDGKYSCSSVLTN